MLYPAELRARCEFWLGGLLQKRNPLLLHW